MMTVTDGGRFPQVYSSVLCASKPFVGLCFWQKSVSGQKQIATCCRKGMNTIYLLLSFYEDVKDVNYDFISVLSSLSRLDI